MQRSFLSIQFLAIALICLAGPAESAVTHWTVQSASSSLMLSGALSSGGTHIFTLEPQGAGSLETYYSGTITSQQDVATGLPTTIQFLSASLTAANSGNWQPLPGGSTGSAPANYGIGYVEFVPVVQAALRDIELNITSGVRPLPGSSPARIFDSIYSPEFTSGVMDYRFNILGIEGSASLEDLQNQFFYFSTIYFGPTETTLTMPLTMFFDSIVLGAETPTTTDDIEFDFQLFGTIIATAPTASVPEASSLALLGLAGSIVGIVGYRRKLATSPK